VKESASETIQVTVRKMAQVIWLFCHVCRQAQRDQRAYRDHLLRVHGEVIRRGSDTPVRLVGRELEVVWSANCRRQMSGPERAARRREALRYQIGRRRDASTTTGLDQPGVLGRQPVLERGPRPL